MPEQKSQYKVLDASLTDADGSKEVGEIIELTPKEAAPLLALKTIESAQQPVPIDTQLDTPQALGTPLLSEQERLAKARLQAEFDTNGLKPLQEQAKALGITPIPKDPSKLIDAIATAQLQQQVDTEPREHPPVEPMR